MNQLKNLLAHVWDALVRWRTYFLNGVLALAFILPEVLNSPEILAVIPSEYQRWFLVSAFLLNIWMRPRPAATKDDAEVKVREALKDTDGAVVTVSTPQETQVISA